MKTKVQFISARGYSVTDVMLIAALAESKLWEPDMTPDQIKVLLDLGLPYDLKHLPATAAAACIDEEVAGELLGAAIKANLAARPWYSKVWQHWLCFTSRHKLEPALSHPDFAEAKNLGGYILYECPFCERCLVNDRGAYYHFSPNTKLAQHRERLNRIEAARAIKRTQTQ